jgi:hypothetical protein
VSIQARLTRECRGGFSGTIQENSWVTQPPLTPIGAHDLETNGPKFYQERIGVVVALMRSDLFVHSIIRTFCQTSASEPLRCLIHTGFSTKGGNDKLAIAAMKAENARVDEVRPREAIPVGEAGNIYQGGGRYISMVGRNGLFHHRADRWPDAVDVNAVASYARAFVTVALTLAKA